MGNDQENVSPLAIKKRHRLGAGRSRCWAGTFETTSLTDNLASALHIRSQWVPRACPAEPADTQPEGVPARGGGNGSRWAWPHPSSRAFLIGSATARATAQEFALTGYVRRSTSPLSGPHAPLRQKTPAMPRAVEAR